MVAKPALVLETRFDLLAAAAFLAFFLAISLAYAWNQSLWVDEATQLSGIRLPFKTQLDWLLGAEIEAIRVPQDRAPPLSYWIGRVWYLALGPGELPMRLLGIAAVFCGLIVLYRGVSGIFGQGVGLAALAFCCVFPGLIVQATEIRPYGLLFMFAVLVLHASLRILQDGPTRSTLLYLYAGCVGATFTHFFGLVLSCSALCVLGSSYLLNARKFPLALTVTAGAYLVTASALALFVVAAVNISGEGAKQSGLVEYLMGNARLAYRLVAHQTMKQFPAGDSIAMLAAAVLLVSGLVRTSKTAHSLSVLAILLVGFTVVSVTSLLTRKFDPLAASYNVWMIPFVAVAVARGTVAGQEWRDIRRPLLLTVFAALLMVSAAGDVALARNGPEYGHTRSRELREIVDKLGAQNVTVIYLNDAGKTRFPMQYWFGDSLRQLVFSGDQLVDTVSKERASVPPKTPYLIAAVTVDLGASQLREVISGVKRLEFPRIEATLDPILNGYRLTDSRIYPAQEALLARIYLKTPAP